MVIDLPASIGARTPGPARVVDLSRVGCLVRCEAAVDAGAIVDLEIELPDGALRAKALVAGCSLDGDSLPGPARHLAGLQFLGLAAADERRLRSFLESQSTRSAGAGEAPS